MGLGGMEIEALDGRRWNETIASLPAAHVLQTWEWSQVKARFGWQPLCRAWQDDQGRLQAAALVLERTAALPLRAGIARVLYVPKGPLLVNWQDPQLRRQVLLALRELAQAHGAVFIKIDPDVRLGTGIPDSDEATGDETGQAVVADLQSLGWRFSQEQVQFRNTVQVDLAASTEELLGRMKQKTRYNIRLAERKGVRVRPAQIGDFDLLYRMYVETSLRDGFVIRERAYYLALWETFMGAGMLDPLVAEVAGEPVAGIVIFRFARRAWYMQGMSRESHREKMPNHLLQWEAMHRAREAGCLTYDLWGAPDKFDPDQPLWGVYRFKEGLGGRLIRHIGAWDLPIRPVLYRLYMDILPRWLDILRHRRRTETRQEMDL